MATYNVIEEGSDPSVVSSGSATVSADPAPAAEYQARDYAAPQYGSSSSSGGVYSSSFDSGSSGGILSKVGLIGAIVVIIGVIIEYSGFAAVPANIGSVDTILVLFPVILVLLRAFREDKIPAVNIFNMINFIVSACVCFWKFFVFVVDAQFSSSLGGGAYGAAASGAFFVFLGEGVIAFSAFISM